MPIVDVELVGEPSEAGLAQRLADGIGEALAAPIGRVWVRVRELPATHYAESGGGAPNPVFVTILASAPPEGEALDDCARRVSAAVARLAGRDASLVHVLFEPGARGRLAFGGRVVR